MKLTSAAKKLETNAQFTSEEFSIGDASIVMAILRDKLYKNKVQVLVQEYISNARDAMREIDSTGRIEITVPTTFNPVFKVRDYGLGISPERMSNVFVKYAASTKRNDNKQTGGFGIGAKSAWAYTDSFTIVTYIDGVQRSYVAHIGANNNGRLDYLGETETSEPNGTEIQVPVNPKDVADFKKATIRTTHLWSKSETPVIKGLSEHDKVERFVGKMYDNLEVTDYAKLPESIVGRYGHANVILSVDGIPYTVTNDLADKIEPLKKLRDTVKGIMLIHLKTGDVNIAANREDLETTNANIDAITAIAKTLYKKVDSVIKSDFAKAKNTFQHLAVYMSLKDQFNLRNYQKCGEFMVNDNGQIESDLFPLVKAEVVTKNYNGELDKDALTKTGRRRSYSRKGYLQGQQFDHLFFNDGSESIIQVNNRLRTYLQGTFQVVVFQKLTTAPEGFNLAQCDKAFETIKSDLGLKDLKTINYVKPPKAERVRIVREKREFCIHNLGSYRRDTIHTTVEDNTQKWLYVEMDGHSIDNKADMRDLAEYIQSTTSYKVCAIAKSAVKMVKDNKNFKALSEFLKDYKATANEVAALKAEIAKNRSMIDKLKRVKGIKNKFLNKMIQEYGSHSYKGGFVPKLLKSAIGKVGEVDDFKADDEKLSTELKTRFPLLDQIHWHGKIEQDEVAYYINAK